MAKRNGEQKTDAVVKVGPEDVAVPAEFLEDVGKGLEGMTRADIKMPRLAVAQGLSPQLNPDEALYIDGLKLGDAYNSLTGEIYGRGPWEVAVVRRDKPRWIEFVPRDEGGGVKDLNVPSNDPRCEWRTLPDAEGKLQRVPPIATQFYDYIIVFLTTREVIAASFKSKGIGDTAQPWNSLLMRCTQAKPMYMGRYTLRAVQKKAPKGTYGTFMVAHTGWVADPETLRFLKSTYEAFREKEVIIDREGQHMREPGEDDDAGM